MLGRVRLRARFALAPGPVLVALLLWAAPARADKFEHVVDWQRRIYGLHGSGEIEVRAAQARVKILPGEEGRIGVSGTLRTTAHDAEAARTASRQSTITVASEGERVIVDAVTHGSTSVELVIEVPGRATVRVRNAAHVEAPKLAGPLDVQTKAGSLAVGLAGAATVHAETAKGKIDQSVGLVVMPGKGRSAVADGRYENGGPQVSLQTGQGNITIHPAR
jgi:hypothetical protein